MYKGSGALKKDGMHRPEAAGNFENMDDYNFVDSVNINTGTIQHIPSDAKDIANKAYVDSFVSSELDPIFLNLSGAFLTAETDPIWLAQSGAFLTDETDPIWLSQSGAFLTSVALDEVDNPIGDKTFTMANKTLAFRYTAPTPAGEFEGAFEIEATGGFTGDLVHIHQHTGNPGEVHMVHLEAEDPDVIPLCVSGAANRTASFIHGNVGIETLNPAAELDVRGTISGATITGANVTSGTDPGHDHTAASITEADTVWLAQSGAYLTAEEDPVFLALSGAFLTSFTETDPIWLAQSGTPATPTS